MTHRFRWPVSIAAAAVTLAAAAGMVAVPRGAAADLPPPRTPRPTVINPEPTPSLAPIVVMSVGDSLTEGTDPATKGTAYASYRPELSRLMTLTGQPHTWVIQALGGTKCSYWAARMGSLLDTYHPNLVLMNCGTNDTPSDATESDYRAILAAAASRHILLVASLIGIPDMRTDTNRVRPYILDWMHGTNLAIKRALASYPSVPVANMERIPDKLTWLNADGIHWNPRGDAGAGQKFFEAAQQAMGWLTFAQMHVTEMCGLDGSWPGSALWPADPEPIPDVDYHVCWS